MLLCTVGISLTLLHYYKSNELSRYQLPIARAIMDQKYTKYALSVHVITSVRMKNTKDLS